MVRDGVLENVPARHVVPGDRIRLEAGDLMPADARLIDAARLAVQEASLTGESVPVDKDAAAWTCPRRPRWPTAATWSTWARRRPPARPTRVVVATGMQTELGRIAGLLEREEPEPTPLERRLGRAGQGADGGLPGDGGADLRAASGPGGEWLEVFLLSVSLAVAAVPEGLPAVVTLALALGLERMVRRNALVRKLPSVETLGSVTVICSDKTGTLTRNEMTVREIVAGGRRYQVTGVGFEPEGDFLRERRRTTRPIQVADERRPDLPMLVTGGPLHDRPASAARCREPVERHRRPDRRGAAGRRAQGRDRSGRSHPSEVVHEIPFDSDRKAMSIVVAEPDRQADDDQGSARGDPGNGDRRVGRRPAQHRWTTPGAAQYLDVAAEMAGRAPCACWPWPSEILPPTITGTYEERDLMFVGLVGMIDPPRDEARGAVELCRTAGIRPIMITGDHPATAAAIAKELGIGGEQVVTGRGAGRDERRATESTAQTCSVYARVTAEHKQRIVRALRAKRSSGGHDRRRRERRPGRGGRRHRHRHGHHRHRRHQGRLRHGADRRQLRLDRQRGRGRARHLRQHPARGPVPAVEQCRRSDVDVLRGAGRLARAAVADSTAVDQPDYRRAAGADPGHGAARPQHHGRPPRPPREPVISRARGGKILAYGVLFALSMGLGFGWLRWQENTSLEDARTVAFCVACFGQMLFAFGCRSDALTFPQIGLFTNRPMLLAIALSAALQLATILIAPLRSIFGTVPLSLEHWLLVVALSIVPVTALEVIKLVCAALSTDHPQA